MRHLYAPLLLLMLSVAPFTKAQDAETPLFPNLEQALYQDAAHAYDDATVLVLSKKTVPQLQSRLIPVMKGDVIDLETYVHYTRSKTKTWQKVGAAAAGLAIGSLPYLLDRGQNLEGAPGNDPLKTVAPLAGAGIATLPFVLNKRRGRLTSRHFSVPKVKNGLFVPNAYLRYKLYDRKGYLLKAETQSIDRHAKDAWQRLSLKGEIKQDGYIIVELGNDSKRPVWIDGFHANYELSARSASEAGIKQQLLPIAPKGPSIPVDTTLIGSIHPCSSGMQSFDDCEGDEDAGSPGGGGSTFSDFVVGGDGSANNPYLLAEGVEVTAEPINDSSPKTESVGNSTYRFTGGNWSIGGTRGGGTSVNSPKGYYKHVKSKEKEGPSGPPPSNPIPTTPGDDGPPYPGKKDWKNMTTNQRISHVIKAIQYARSKGASVNLNSYFYNLPLAGNSGFGKQFRLTGAVKINGKTIPITIEIPVITSERIFNSTPIDSNRLYDPSARYGPHTQYYYFGLGNRYKNTAKIYFNDQYTDDLDDIIGY